MDPWRKVTILARVLETMTVSDIRREAEEAARDALAVHWSDGALPVDPIRIARGMGAEVFTAELGNDVFGLVASTPGGGASIYLDADQPPNRLRFTCAHEVGHLVEHQAHDEERRLDFVDKRSDSDRGQPQEVWANHFAGALLMPEHLLLQHDRDGVGDVRLAAMFGVSLPALRYRLSLVRAGR